MAHYMIAFGKFNVTSTVVKGLFSVQLKKKRWKTFFQKLKKD